MIKRVLVVGGGIAGLSTAWALARRGVAVELFEQGPLPNPRSSSHDEHRIIRHAYGQMQGYARLMPEAFRVWERLWQALGARHYEPTGLVYFERHETGWHDAVSRSLDAMGIGHRQIPLADAARRFPMVREEGLIRVVETDGAGILFPVPILTGLVTLLGRLGVRLHSGAPVTAIDLDRGTLVSGGTEHAADMLVVAAGAWADRLVPSVRGIAVPSRQAVLYVSPPAGLAQAWAEAPVMIDLNPDGGLYTLPPRRGMRLKFGDHRFGLTGDPDDDRFATDEDLSRLLPAARAIYRDFDGYDVLERKGCFYTVTEGEQFLVKPIGMAGWLVSACSGHGFKLGPLIGELVGRAISGEMPAKDLSELAAGRASGAKIKTFFGK